MSLPKIPILNLNSKFLSVYTSIHMNIPPRPASRIGAKPASGRRVGAKKYRTKEMLDVIERVLPVGADSWKVAASLYQDASGEPNLRDYADFKKHFIVKLCDGNRKPTGRAAPRPVTERAQSIHRLILEKHSAIIEGADEDDFDGVDAD